MKFLDQVVISSFFRTTLLPRYYYYYYYYHHHHHRARFGTRAADSYVSNCSMGSSCFSELIYSRHAVKSTLYQIICVNLKMTAEVLTGLSISHHVCILIRIKRFLFTCKLIKNADSKSSFFRMLLTTNLAVKNYMLCLKWPTRSYILLSNTIKLPTQFYLSTCLCTYFYVCMCMCTYVWRYCIRKAGKSAFWVPFLAYRWSYKCQASAL
jgi:hypothetical protein